MKLVLKKTGNELHIKPRDEYEYKAMQSLGDAFGYNKYISMNNQTFKGSIIAIVNELILLNNFLVASDLLRISKLILDYDRWKVVK